MLIADKKMYSQISFSVNLKLLREEKGYTQEYFAELIGVSDRMVRKWESGQNSPRLSTVYKIVDILETSMISILL